MKPEGLKISCTWEERHPFIQEGVFFVPRYYAHHKNFSLPPWSNELLFGNGHPVSVEYGSGNGDWIVERACRFPERNWVAVEKEFDRIRKIWSKGKNQQVKNLFLVCGEAYTFTHHYVASGSVEEVFINFPDPWPKQKQRKHRLMQPPFLDELSRILLPGKQVTFVSDDAPYLAATHHLFATHPYFGEVEEHPLSEAYGVSWFEQLWRAQGRTLRSLTALRTARELSVTHENRDNLP